MEDGGGIDVEDECDFDCGEGGGREGVGEELRRRLVKKRMFETKLKK